MKRFIYTVVAGAVMVASSSNLAMAGHKDDDKKGKDGKDDQGSVTMCHQPRKGNIEITVKEKDVAEHQSEGDTVGRCPAPAPPIIGIVG